MRELIYKEDAISALGEEPEVWENDDEYSLGLKTQWKYDMLLISALLPIQTETCEGCKYDDKFETDEYICPCTDCKRRARDNYER